MADCTRRNTSDRDFAAMWPASWTKKTKTPARCRGLRGADDRDRTGDLHLGKVTLYQLSHVRNSFPSDISRMEEDRC